MGRKKRNKIEGELEIQHKHQQAWPNKNYGVVILFPSLIRVYNTLPIILQPKHFQCMIWNNRVSLGLVL
ncbi:unnamed protein product [Amoebophrya sp. A25]|nr:unnamed protein product [Amoebophrya sp. A25]|eukprot:GSA25T00001480001.1